MNKIDSTIKSFDGQKWNEEPEMRHPRCGAAAISMEANQMLIIGGPRNLPTERRTFGKEMIFLFYLKLTLDDSGKMLLQEWSQNTLSEYMFYPEVFFVPDDWASKC